MRFIARAFIIIFIVCAYLKCKSAFAEDPMQALWQQISTLQQTVTGLQTTINNQNKLIENQNIKIVHLTGQIEKVRTAQLIAGSQAAGIMQPVPQIQAPLKMRGVSQAFNPDIGLAASIQANSTENREDGEGNDTIAVKELELNVSQYVDPYSRLDSVIAFNDNIEEQNVDIEEAYYTHWGLPMGFQGQIGKFRSKIGKANLLHSHQLETVDYPVVIRNFFGEEGLASSGARLQNFIPNPWDVPIELTGEVLRGNNGASFSGISRRPIFSTHLKTFFQTSESTNLELGSTVMFGDENPKIITYENDELTTEIPEAGQDKYGVKVLGFDATFKANLPEGRSAKWQNEIYFQNRATQTRFENANPWGFYSLADARISQRFSTGVRFDFVQPLDVNGNQTTAISPYITFWQSEFADFRLQYSYTRPASGAEEPNNEVFVKANLLIGAHKHPVQ